MRPHFAPPQCVQTLRIFFAMSPSLDFIVGGEEAGQLAAIDEEDGLVLRRLLVFPDDEVGNFAPLVAVQVPPLVRTQLLAKLRTHDFRVMAALRDSEMLLGCISRFGSVVPALVRAVVPCRVFR